MTDMRAELSATLKSNIATREQEVFGYEFNIENFERMLAKLPQDWTPEVRDMQRRKICTEAEALEVGRHVLRDDLRVRLINERVQLQTAQLVLDVLREQLSQ